MTRSLYYTAIETASQLGVHPRTVRKTDFQSRWKLQARRDRSGKVLCTKTSVHRATARRKTR